MNTFRRGDGGMNGESSQRVRHYFLNQEFSVPVRAVRLPPSSRNKPISERKNGCLEAVESLGLDDTMRAEPSSDQCGWGSFRNCEGGCSRKQRCLERKRRGRELGSLESR